MLYYIESDNPIDHSCIIAANNYKSWSDTTNVPDGDSTPRCQLGTFVHSVRYE
jgi:hypothetical protein